MLVVDVLTFPAPKPIYTSPLFLASIRLRVFVEFLTLNAKSADNAVSALTSNFTVDAGVSPTPNPLFVLSQNN